MAQLFFTARVYDYDAPANKKWRNYVKSFNTQWCDFEELSPTDPKAVDDGMNSKILYFLGHAPQAPKEYFVTETIYELGALAGKIASSAPAA